ncbi:septum formation initiator family protein [Bacteriovorax sp. DB6_IX]|uniref:FtsB family cell division protein n=1 Tax=Bacteriovorax sp. DB6_IX TaxID=1353530 RepID=UPI000389F9B1|nr:septum formation initiator family protein [Bacteriovorax sp. DB6_IX]EQC51755.1 septum formation initiator [Bacteriovorax sp. DB6_IX]
MQFSFDRRSSSAESAPTASAGADEKLKKAIERNRAKMAKRQMRSSPPPSGATPPPVRNAGAKPSLADKLRRSTSSGLPGKTAPQSAQAPQAAQRPPQRPTPSASESLIDKMRARRGTPSPSQASATPSSNTSVRRRQVTDPNNIEMAEPIQRRTTAPAPVAYSDATPVKAPSKTSVKAKRTVKTKSKKSAGLTGWAVKGTWAFCTFLLLRLIFSEGGVIEYYDKKSALDQKRYELETLKKENVSLMEELEMIRSNSRYQKKLVRDHLGYIARDEYLILFPESRNRRYN